LGHGVEPMTKTIFVILALSFAFATSPPNSICHQPENSQGARIDGAADLLAQAGEVIE
jgi:hypothetical protein